LPTLQEKAGTLEAVETKGQGSNFKALKSPFVFIYAYTYSVPLFFLKLSLLVPIISNHKQIPISPTEAGIPTISENIV
jgi:hypothetical protein